MLSHLALTAISVRTKLKPQSVTMRPSAPPHLDSPRAAFLLELC